MKHVVVSPHFDDAIGSCGATISRLRRHDEEVVVQTIFGGTPSPPYSEFALRLHAVWGSADFPVPTRLEEDKRACAVLGCAQGSLGILEGLYRNSAEGAHLYPDEPSLFGPIASEDHELHVVTSRELAGGAGISDLRFYVPLGVGHHVDHVIAFRMGLEWARLGYSVWFYRDFFYTDWDCPHFGGHRGRALVQRLPAIDLEQKVKAFLHYRSQIRMLFGDAASAVSYFAGANPRRGRSRFQEVLWQLDRISPDAGSRKVFSPGLGHRDSRADHPAK